MTDDEKTCEFYVCAIWTLIGFLLGFLLCFVTLVL